MIKKFTIPFILFLLILPTFTQLIQPGFFPMQDDIQAFRIHQMTKCLKDFQIPCRWVPDMGYQYGYPKFNYYPPFPYYIGASLNLFGIQIIDVVKILFILGFVLSAVTMFVFLKRFLNEWSALVGSVLYTFVPIKAVQVYVRGSLSEFWAFIFLPLLFWSSLSLIKTKKKKYFLWFAISLASLILTHNLTAFIFVPILVVWILTVIVIEKDRKGWLRVFLSSVIGIGLSAFYLLPLLFEKQYVHLETLLGGYFDYRQHFVSIGQLLFSNYFNYGSSVFGLSDDVSLSTGILHWMAAFMAIVWSIFFYKKEKRLAIIIWTLSGIEFMVLFLMHIKSSFIWERITILAFLQFPWRFLVPSAFLLSILSSCAFYLLYKFNKKFALVFGIVLVLCSILLNANFFKPKEWLMISDREKFTGQSWERQLTTSIFDYLPIFAKLPPNKKAPLVPEVLEGDVEFLTYQKGSNFQLSEMNIKEDSLIRLPLFDFPGMEVKVDERVIRHVNNDCRNQEYCLGLISFSIPSGLHTIKVQLKDTPVRTIGNIITLLSFLVLIFLMNKSFRHRL